MKGSKILTIVGGLVLGLGLAAMLIAFAPTVPFALTFVGGTVVALAGLAIALLARRRSVETVDPAEVCDQVVGSGC
jgi:hypothetical protein